jgi:hypothetical protein
MKVKIAFRNPRSGEVKEVKVGWSWTLFLFSGLFGLPLFLRKLNALGGVSLALLAINMVAPAIVGNVDRLGGMVLKVAMSLICLGFQVWVGVKGNEMTAKNYLEHGWQFVDPDSEMVKLAKARWGIML